MASSRVEEKRAVPRAAGPGLTSLYFCQRCIISVRDVGRRREGFESSGNRPMSLRREEPWAWPVLRGRILCAGSSQTRYSVTRDVSAGSRLKRRRSSRRAPALTSGQNDMSSFFLVSPICTLSARSIFRPTTSSTATLRRYLSSSRHHAVERKRVLLMDEIQLAKPVLDGLKERYDLLVSPSVAAPIVYEHG